MPPQASTVSGSEGSLPDGPKSSITPWETWSQALRRHSTEPMALPARSLEANVPSNFNLVTLEGATIGELKFYGQGAGSLPTGNAMVQDVIDFAEGRRPTYDFSRGLVYDPALLAGDYVLRTAMPMPQGAEPYDAGAWLVRDIDPASARALFDDALAADPTSFMAYVPQED